MIHYHLYIIISQLLQMKTIIIYDHLLIVNFLDFPLSSIIINNQHYLFSMCDHHQTSIIIYYHLLSSIIIHKWSPMIIHYHPFTMIIHIQHGSFLQRLPPSSRLCDLQHRQLHHRAAPPGHLSQRGGTGASTWLDVDHQKMGSSGAWPSVFMTGWWF